MKRLFLWIAVGLSVLALCGCRSQENNFDFTYSEKTYTVDAEEGTITSEEGVYRFALSGSDRDHVSLDITYPDGSQYHWSKSGSAESGSWSTDYAPEDSGYVPGEALWDILTVRLTREPGRSGHPVLALLLLAVGAFQAITPQTAWMLSDGWRFKNAEPSESALTAHRAAGIVMIFAGAILLLAAF